MASRTGSGIVSDEAIFNFILEFKKTNDGNSPTISQIGKAIGRSKSATYYRLCLLEKKGLITLPVGLRRTAFIKVVGGKWNYVGG